MTSFARANSALEELEDENFELKRKLRALTADVDPIVVGLLRRGLTLMEARVIAVIVAKGTVSREAIETIIYDMCDACASNTIKVIVCRARKKLPARVRIKTLFGIGYSMSKEDVDALKDWLRTEVRS